MVVGPGRGEVTPPAHRHAFTETFYVLQGVLGGQIEGEPFEAPAGTAVDVAGGLAHAWWNAGSAPVRTLVICAPGGFERFFEELAATVAELPPGPPDMAKVRSIIARLWPEYGIEPVAEALS
jgi:mannose-6-phosphate isomerase-like protein (cupin superfamily)